MFFILRSSPWKKAVCESRALGHLAEGLPVFSALYWKVGALRRPFVVAGSGTETSQWRKEPHQNLEGDSLWSMVLLMYSPQAAFLFSLG